MVSAVDISAQNLTLATGEYRPFDREPDDDQERDTLSTGARGGDRGQRLRNRPDGGRGIADRRLRLDRLGDSIRSGWRPRRSRPRRARNANQFLVEADSLAIATGSLRRGAGRSRSSPGTFVLRSSDRINNSTTINVRAAGVFNLSTFNETIFALGVQSGDGSGSLVTSSGSGT